MQKNRFSNITSYKTANAPKPFNPPPAPKIDPEFEKKLRAAKNIDELKKAYSSGGKSDAAAKQRKGAVATFIKLSNKLNKTGKGSAGQRSTTTKSTKPAPVQPKGKSTKPAPVQPAKNKGNTGSSRDGRSGTGTYGKQLPSNPQLKSQTKSRVQRAAKAFKKGKFASRDMAKGRYGKPIRSDYPSGRTGALQYAAALRKFRKNPAPPAKSRMYNRRGRPLS